MHRCESLETGLAQALGNSPAQVGLWGGREQCQKGQWVPLVPQVLRVTSSSLLFQVPRVLPESGTLPSSELAAPGRNRNKPTPGIAVGPVGHGEAGGPAVC